MNEEENNQNIQTTQNKINQRKKPLVKVFKLEESEWIEVGIGIIQNEIKQS